MELENIKSTVKRFFELRESKLVSAALDTTRTGLPLENVTKDEEKVFYAVVEALKKHREDFFSALSSEKEERQLYRVKRTIQPFVGPDMKNYLLRERELVEMPPALTDLL